MLSALMVVLRMRMRKMGLTVRKLRLPATGLGIILMFTFLSHSSLLSRVDKHDQTELPKEGAAKHHFAKMNGALNATAHKTGTIQMIFSNKACFSSFDQIEDTDRDRIKWQKTLIRNIHKVEFARRLDELGSPVNTTVDSSEAWGEGDRKLGIISREEALVRLAATSSEADDEGTSFAVRVSAKRPHGPQLVKQFRKAVNFAADKINKAVHNVTTCNFPYFTAKESRQIWHLASRRVQQAVACERFAPFFSRLHDVHKTFVWDTDTHLGYCPVFKTGTTTWISRLLEWSGLDSSSLSTRAVHEWSLKMFPPLAAPALSKEVRQYQPLFITVARHPFVRIVSAYVNRVMEGYRPIERQLWIRTVRGQSFLNVILDLKEAILDKAPYIHLQDQFQKLLQLKIDPNDLTDLKSYGDAKSTNPYMTFREFVHWIIHENIYCIGDVTCLRNIDEHWQPQYVQCSPCTMRYDVISKMDTFDDDADLILKLLGRPDNGTSFSSNSSTTKSGGTSIPPSGSSIPSSEKSIPLPGSSIFLSGNSTTPFGMNTSSGINIPPPGRSIPPSGRSIPPSRKNIPPSGRNIPPPGRKIPLSGSSVPPAKDRNFRRRNVSLGSAAANITREYLKELTKEEIRYLYMANYMDFILYGFSPDIF